MINEQLENKYGAYRLLTHDNEEDNWGGTDFNVFDDDNWGGTD